MAKTSPLTKPHTTPDRDPLGDVRIPVANLKGEDICVMVLGADDQDLFLSPLAKPLLQGLAKGSGPLSPDQTTLHELVAAARTQNTAVSGTVIIPDARLERVFDLTVVPVLTDGKGPENGTLLISGHDVTLPTSMRRTLVESRQRYKDLVEISAAFAWETNTRGALVFVSPQGILGYAIDELIGHRPEEFLAEPLDGSSTLPFTTRQPLTDVEVWMRRADGSAVCLLVSALPLYDENANWTGVRGICRDITDVRERDIAIARARNRERLLSFIVRSFRDEVDPENMLNIAAATVAQGVGVSGCNVFRIRHPADANHQAPLSDQSFSPAAEFGRLGGADAKKAVLSELCMGRDVVEMTIDKWNVMAAVTRYRQAVNGAIILWRELSRVPYDDDDRILLSDLSAQVGIAIEQISNHEHILDLSRTDALTGLFNRRAFIEEIERHAQRLRHEKRTAALMYVDLDNFKMVNDIHGHKRGDEALQAVRSILLACTRPTDLVARLGGDEFAAWMDGADEAIAITKAHRLVEESRALDMFSGSIDRPLSMSIGIAIYNPETEESIDALLSRADTAMYTIKHSGKGSFSLASRSM